MLTSAVITGLGLGSMYGLLALGFHVTYAVSNTVNFAQGGTMMMGAVLSFTLSVTAGWAIISATPVAPVACPPWGIPLRRRPPRPLVRRGAYSLLMGAGALRLPLPDSPPFCFRRVPR